MLHQNHSDLGDYAHGPHLAYEATAVTVVLEINRIKRVIRPVTRLHEIADRKQGEDVGLTQHMPDRHMRLRQYDFFALIHTQRAEPYPDELQQQYERQRRRAVTIRHRTQRRHRDDEADRAPNAETRIT